MENREEETLSNALPTQVQSNWLFLSGRDEQLPTYHYAFPYRVCPWDHSLQEEMLGSKPQALCFLVMLGTSCFRFCSTASWITTYWDLTQSHHRILVSVGKNGY